MFGQMRTGDAYLTAVHDAYCLTNNSSNLHDKVVSACLSGASAETLASGAGAIANLESRFKSDEEHPSSLPANDDAHTDMDDTFDHITFMIPGLHRLSTEDLKKEDMSELELMKEPQMDRVRKTGYAFCSNSSDGFRRSLQKWVKKEKSDADHRTFHQEAEQLRQKFCIVKVDNKRRSRFAVGRSDQWR